MAIPNVGGIIPLEKEMQSVYFAPVAATTLIKDSNFKLLNASQKPDSKRRVSIGSALTEGVAYAIYRNRTGQIVLNPVVTVPASEVWLFKNQKALASVKRGLRDSAAGRTRHRGSFAKFTKE